MSRIDDLLAELAPDGVPYVPLGDIARIRNGSDYKHHGAGDVPVYGSGGVIARTAVAAHDGPSVLIPRKGSLGNVFYVDEPFWTVDTIFYTEIAAHQVVPKFLYHYVLTLRLETMNQAGGVPSQTQSVLNRLRIPVPPLEVQREIVRILDQFTGLEAELEAELEARRQQFEYIRRELLAGKNLGESSPLGELTSYVRGVTYAKPDEVRDGGPGHRLLRSNNIDSTSNRLNLVDVRVVAPRVRVRHDQNLRAGDILMSAASGSRSHVGKVAYIEQDLPETFGGFMAVIRTKPALEPKYLFHHLASRRFGEFLDREITSSTINNLTGTILGRFSVPVPRLETQQRVAAMLDTFDALVNDLSSGLPAEIAARRRQYEYYRDRLLTFEEARS